MKKILLSLSFVILVLISWSQNQPVVNITPNFNGQTYCEAAPINDFIALEDPQADPVTYDSLDVSGNLSPGNITVTFQNVNVNQYEFLIDITAPYTTGTNLITLHFSDDNFNTTVVNLTVTYDVINTTYSGITDFCSAQTVYDISTSISSTGGQPPYSYTYSGIGVTGNFFDPQITGPGTYTVTISTISNDGCTINLNETFIVNSTPALTNISNSNPSTCGGTDGEIYLDVSSGTPPFNLTYNPSGNINNYSAPIPNLPQGTYDNFQVVDANGCTNSYLTSITLVEPTPTSYNVGADTTICNGEEIILTVPTTPSYSNVTWDNGVFNGNPFTPTTTTTYTATITDPNNCVSTDDITVNVTPLIPYTFNSTSITICDNFGPIDLNTQVNVTPGVFGGIGVINNTFDPIFLNGSGFSEINHNYTDINGCTRSDTLVITINDSPSLSFTITDASCTNFDGAIDATITGGQPPYTTYWNNGSNNEDISNLHPAIYYMNVVDANNCLSMGAATVSSTSITITENVTNVSCYGMTDGAIDLTVTGGTPPYQIEWLNDGQLIEDRTNLHAATWDVNVIDANGCQASKSIIVGGSTPLYSQVISTPANCSSNDGMLDVIANGGSAPYVYSINSGPQQGNGLFSGLISGYYFIEVVDANGCTTIENAVVSETTSAIINTQSITNETCSSLGAIDISIISQSGVNSINWSNGATTEDVSNLTTGNYFVSVVDNNGCISSQQFNIENERPAVQEICMIGVDSATQTNKVVWEKPITTDISHYNMYRETSVAGQYIFVDSVLYTDESFFVDSVAYPHMRSWRYKITAVNSCGIESFKSPHHKTIHLVRNNGTSGQVNLNWDHYEGFTYSSYYLSRYTAQNGWELIATLPSTDTYYPDTPPFYTDLDYELSIIHPSVCVSTKATSHNASRSNRSNGLAGPNGPGNTDNTLSISENENDLDIQMYPNPTNGIVNLVWLAQNNNTTYQITDISGKVIKNWKASNQNEIIDFSDFSNGLYFLNIKNENGRKEFKIIKN